MPNRRVLVVEDDLVSAEVLTQVLKPMFKDVVHAPNGLAAYKIFIDDFYGFDLIISDIQMPSMDGLEFLQNIRNIKPTIPIAIISAFDEKEYLMSAINLKVEKYLVKPVTKQAIANMVRECFERELREEESFFYEGKMCLYENKKHTVAVDGESVSLTKNESKVLRLLLSRKSRKANYKEIGFFVWGNEDENINSIHSLVRRLRKKLPDGMLEFIQKEGYHLNIKLA